MMNKEFLSACAGSDIAILLQSCLNYNRFHFVFTRDFVLKTPLKRERWEKISEKENGQMPHISIEMLFIHDSVGRLPV